MNRIAKSVATRTILANAGWKHVTGNARLSWLNQVWAMYQESYRAIGMGIARARDLFAEYDDWWIHFNGDTPDAFRIGKKTRWGVKAGASGTDGSPGGKQAARQMVGQMFNVLGNYGEVSHAIEHFARQAGAPVVCANDAQTVLAKPIDPQDDGIHYARVITGVGKAVKVMVGSPKGIQTTSWESPACSTVRTARVRSSPHAHKPIPR